jgi:hypothetical protein
MNYTLTSSDKSSGSKTALLLFKKTDRKLRSKNRLFNLNNLIAKFYVELNDI